MKGVILAGGKGTRLEPLTLPTNKHLLPVYDQPMIFYPIQTLVKAGIKNILVIAGEIHAGQFVSVLKNGKQFGLDHLEYAYQEGGSKGIADALSYAEDFADHGPVTIILGDNTTDADISSPVKNFKQGATIFLKKVPDPERFGNPEFDKNDPQKIITIHEKPPKAVSPYAVTGLYIYDTTVFDIIKSLKPSGRGELEVTDINNAYLKKGRLNWAELSGFWSDAGTFYSLYRSNRYWAKKKLGDQYQQVVKGIAIPGK
ncbi:MAG: Glucose-1-phosphate thymidylyltransferase [Candidatus Beckwithbacteria bacterium GW2011_GWB1_47_15]|uniref:glucose-1-phosphate thymidylyltransferase n=1 Tax=Candidatus Beckwithbacteria bacterium GW2011_GWB1_47_15 TaxID=1618371 RepID=A0A0G1RV99_9BACT|nr:MAG: glucose-1-phosphate thymidylyltransferase, glucose-1-phosphate thymidylyltransferase [Candidatus Beckwithbacteria bacterium GW2011_GWC1_49_16]KKU35777.1 MAG: Glucose-1-phosphate thymidylyltransferase [Candidatus Beckwithbacteria bacterium GW2011_GWA1_46_30]KKU61031.1 MAG: Glucose-1-phosphate thymidylyltransferase [Candidatus Beckwithbacteria bacterium GW2011_GWB1_47_15]KKU72336.1 MAG: Glucose-1-phosphate thymidylyltransferase [Candidatus Beckwithbacteria bacterium GW2011_GWA2_47_25]KKW0